MKALVLSGGTGTRLRPFTHTGAKQLIPVANKPILFYVLEDIKECDITDVGIIVGHTKDEVKNAVEDGSKFGLKVTYIEQDKPAGLAHAVKIAKDFLKDDRFVMYLGDNILKNGIKDLYEEYKNSKYDALISLCHVPNPQQFGVAEMEGDKVIRLVEKPKEPKTDLALVGVYFFNSTIFDAVGKLKPSWRNELEITEAIQGLIDSNHAVHAKIVTGWWKDTGTSQDILAVNQLVLMDLKSSLKGKIEQNVNIIGNVDIGENTIIKEGTRIRGPVIIGDNCTIGPNTYVGPYTSIGDNTTIIGGEIECSIIIGETHINCGKRIIDSLIGKNSIIGSIKEQLPESGYKLIIGENCTISL
ncbi:MAG: glucose-1-phosphate thymidylyltransferase [Candidatus Helarchaeota archaeon]|nr:glucose-1-phosphate thymidylyltransferase [Candidatus Helarchaeota archaeon]